MGFGVPWWKTTHFALLLTFKQYFVLRPVSLLRQAEPPAVNGAEVKLNIYIIIIRKSETTKQTNRPKTFRNDSRWFQVVLLESVGDWYEMKLFKPWLCCLMFLFDLSWSFTEQMFTFSSFIEKLSSAWRMAIVLMTTFHGATGSSPGPLKVR